MRPWMIVCLLGAAALPSFAHASSPSDEEISVRAAAAFQQGVEHKTQILEARKYFSEATDLYHELHRRGVRSPALYLNLGNAAVLANRWPLAVWAYHAGLKLDPNDRALRAHLVFVRAKVNYPPAGQGRLDAETWPTWLHRPTLYELSLVGISSYMLAWLAATCAFLTRKPRLYLATMAMVGVLLVAGMGGWHELHQIETDRQTPLVVLTANAEFYRGNGVSYPQHPVLPILPRGLELRQLHRRGQWLQIRLTTGEVGWVPISSALVVEP